MDKNTCGKKLSMSNTKQEMLEAYGAVLKNLEEKSLETLNPEEKIAQKRESEIIKAADALSSAGVTGKVSGLKTEIAKILDDLSLKLEDECSKYVKIKGAIAIKETELKEIFEIDKTAQTLAALIEAQLQSKKEFEEEAARKKEEFSLQMQAEFKTREDAKKAYEAGIKERDAQDAKTRQREKEEYEYAFKREQQLAKYKFEDEKVKMEKELLVKKETAEKQLAEREKIVQEKEAKLAELQKRIDNFPKELDTAVTKTAKEVSEKLSQEAHNKDELLMKSFEGERNVLQAKADSLERTVKEQKEQIIKLSQQLENAYKKVEDIAVKSVGGFSDYKAYLNLTQKPEEQNKK